MGDKVSSILVLTDGRIITSGVDRETILWIRDGDLKKGGKVGWNIHHGEGNIPWADIIEILDA